MIQTKAGPCSVPLVVVIRGGGGGGESIVRLVFLIVVTWGGGGWQTALCKRRSRAPCGRSWWGSRSSPPWSWSTRAHRTCALTSGFRVVVFLLLVFPLEDLINERGSNKIYSRNPWLNAKVWSWRVVLGLEFEKISKNSRSFSQSKLSQVMTPKKSLKNQNQNVSCRLSLSHPLRCHYYFHSHNHSCSHDDWLYHLRCKSSCAVQQALSFSQYLVSRFNQERDKIRWLAIASNLHERRTSSFVSQTIFPRSSGFIVFKKISRCSKTLTLSSSSHLLIFSSSSLSRCSLSLLATFFLFPFSLTVTQLLQALVAPTTCLDTPRASTTIEWLRNTNTTTSSWWYTWYVFQVQYYDMPRKPNTR